MDSLEKGKKFKQTVEIASNLRSPIFQPIVNAFVHKYLRSEIIDIQHISHNDPIVKTILVNFQRSLGDLFAMISTSEIGAEVVSNLLNQGHQFTSGTPNIDTFVDHFVQEIKNKLAKAVMAYDIIKYLEKSPNQSAIINYQTRLEACETHLKEFMNEDMQWRSNLTDKTKENLSQNPFLNDKMNKIVNDISEFQRLLFRLKYPDYPLN